MFMDTLNIVGGLLLDAMFALFGGAIAGVLLVSERRAPTERRKYIYSPTYAPTMRTPKWVFAVAACVTGLAFSLVAFHQDMHGANPLGAGGAIPAQVLHVLAVTSEILLWGVGPTLLGTAALLIRTTRPLDEDGVDVDAPGPSEPK
jgi:hypothetical protein